MTPGIFMVNAALAFWATYLFVVWVDWLTAGETLKVNPPKPPPQRLTTKGAPLGG